MLLTPHALVGAAIGTSTDNIPLIIILAFLSHFILDAIPHFDWGTWHNYQDFKLEAKDYILAFCDLAISLILLSYLWHNLGRNNNILIGACLAVLVDLIDNVPIWKDKIRKIPVLGGLHQCHRIIHYQIQAKHWYWGVATQVIIIIITLQFLIPNEIPILKCSNYLNI